MFGKIKNFFTDVKSELKKVAFPSKDDVIGSTRVVVVLVLIIAVFLGVIDLVLSRLISLVVR